ncbi:MULTISPECIES: DUF1802 family protein [Candidatus Nitrosocaldus]|uniref:DUF1802 family protein n=1 Tax=Candidatus Nitrosocaldus cavascurensis TaxID=2058097 RepID=A0A2K5AP45_9ARCH|nr:MULTISPECIES: DUF1802 family protein [Candidatus Nitrosocaldus]SPC33412.1 conserved protein of unknown function [Candidatus Nitrosocaldus cavascurensis]
MANTAHTTDSKILGWHALKEWAIVVRAVEQGKHFILFRKGGILEDGFSVASNEFLLFPTFEHQSRQYIKDEYRLDYDMLEVHAPVDKVVIRSAARVASYYESSDKSRLLKLNRYHIYNDLFLDYRMQWNRDKPVSVMLVRAYRLEEPIVVDMKGDYYGCRSWIRLDQDDLKGVRIGKPVVDDIIFDRIKREVDGVMAG